MKVKVAQSCPTVCDPVDCTVRGILQARILEWIALPFSRGSSQPRDQTHVSRTVGGFFFFFSFFLFFRVDSLPAESQGKPKNTGVGSLSLIWQILPTQESNQCLLHCRWSLYQLSYEVKRKLPKQFGNWSS